jgi:hypothetical protein
VSVAGAVKTLPDRLLDLWWLVQRQRRQRDIRRRTCEWRSTVIRRRNMALVARHRLPEQRRPAAAILNVDLDRVWLALQEILGGNQVAPNAIHAQPGESLDVLAPAASRKDHLLGFNSASGQPEMSSFTMTQVACVVAAVYAAAAGPLDALSFLQGGAGAVSRSAQDKAREIVSLEDFGALGDGVSVALNVRYASLAAGAGGFSVCGAQ